jgi:hypothetical protein
MNVDMLLAQKIKTAKMKLLTALDSAHVAQYEHYLMSNYCLFCSDAEDVCDGSPERDADEAGASKKNKQDGGLSL